MQITLSLSELRNLIRRTVELDCVYRKRGLSQQRIVKEIGDNLLTVLAESGRIDYGQARATNQISKSVMGKVPK